MVTLLLIPSRPESEYKAPYSLGQAYVYRWRELMGKFPREFALFADCFRSNRNERLSFDFIAEGVRLELFKSWTEMGNDDHPYRAIPIEENAAQSLRLCMRGVGVDLFIMDHPLPGESE